MFLSNKGSYFGNNCPELMARIVTYGTFRVTTDLSCLVSVPIVVINCNGNVIVDNCIVFVFDLESCHRIQGFVFHTCLMDNVKVEL